MKIMTKIALRRAGFQLPRANIDRGGEECRVVIGKRCWIMIKTEKNWNYLDRLVKSKLKVALIGIIWSKEYTNRIQRVLWNSCCSRCRTEVFLKDLVLSMQHSLKSSLSKRSLLWSLWATQWTLWRKFRVDKTYPTASVGSKSSLVRWAGCSSIFLIDRVCMRVCKTISYN